MKTEDWSAGTSKLGLWRHPLPRKRHHLWAEEGIIGKSEVRRPGAGCLWCKRHRHSTVGTRAECCSAGVGLNREVTGVGTTDADVGEVYGDRADIRYRKREGSTRLWDAYISGGQVGPGRELEGKAGPSEVDGRRT